MPNVVLHMVYSAPHLPQGRASFVKLPLHHTHVSVRKCLVRDILMGPPWRREAKGIRLPLAPTPPGDRSCTHDDERHHDHKDLRTPGG
jgi:hypothetical protein